MKSRPIQGQLTVCAPSIPTIVHDSRCLQSSRLCRFHLIPGHRSGLLGRASASLSAISRSSRGSGCYAGRGHVLNAPNYGRVMPHFRLRKYQTPKTATPFSNHFCHSSNTLTLLKARFMTLASGPTRSTQLVLSVKGDQIQYGGERVDHICWPRMSTGNIQNHPPTD